MARKAVLTFYHINDKILIMETKIFLNKDELLASIKEAKTRVRILGAVSFDLPYEELRENWYERINNGELQVEIICESESDLTYSSLLFPHSLKPLSRGLKAEPGTTVQP